MQPRHAINLVHVYLIGAAHFRQHLAEPPAIRGVGAVRLETRQRFILEPVGREPIHNGQPFNALVLR